MYPSNLSQTLRRKQQPSNALLPRIPPELQLKIFEVLGPITRRILGTTCKQLQEMWTEYYYETTIRIHLHEFHHKVHSGKVGTKAFRKLVSQWARPKNALKGASKAEIREVKKDCQMVLMIDKMAPQTAYQRWDGGLMATFKPTTNELMYGNVVLEYESWKVVATGGGKNSYETSIAVEDF